MSFIINPKTHKTDANERNVLKAALELYIKTQNKRAETMRDAGRVDEAIFASARAQDLLVKFQ